MMILMMIGNDDFDDDANTVVLILMVDRYDVDSKLVVDLILCELSVEK
jgi:hypothetical protein